MDASQIGPLMTTVLRTFCLCGMLLLIGTVLRAKVKFFQNLYIPACVIGGFIGLILSPTVLGTHAIVNTTPESQAIMAKIAPVLFMMIMAGMPMCSAPLNRKTLKEKGDVWVLAIVISAVFAMQFAIGFLVNAAFKAAGSDIYVAFGAELPQGFTGGHGIAPMHGSMLESLGQPYWETAQGVTLTTATVGIICGILIGITLINIAARKGYTKYIKDPADIPEDFRTGFFRSREEQPEIGKQTTNNGTIDTFAWHLSLILLVTGAGYLIDDFAHAHSIPILTDLSAWVYMLLLMYAIWPLIVHFKLDRHFNAQVKGKITGTISDFIIVAAIVSIPLDMVLAYWKPILVMCVLGLIITPAMIWFGCKICCQTDWLEKCMGPMGMNHGDFITGVLLIKMCDPNMQSDALEDFSLGYTIHNFYALPLFLFIVPYVVARGPVSGAIFCLIQVALMFVLLVICNKIFKRKAA